MSLADVASAFRQGLRQPAAPPLPRASGPASEAASPEERLGEASRLYDWQIRDLSSRLVGCNDPSEAARLHARITETRARFDAVAAQVATHKPIAAAAFVVHLSYPERPTGPMPATARFYITSTLAAVTTEDVCAAVPDAQPGLARRVLDAVRAAVTEKLNADTPPQSVNAVDGTR